MIASCLFLPHLAHVKLEVELPTPHMIFCSSNNGSNLNCLLLWHLFCLSFFFPSNAEVLFIPCSPSSYSEDDFLWAFLMHHHFSRGGCCLIFTPLWRWSSSLGSCSRLLLKTLAGAAARVRPRTRRRGGTARRSPWACPTWVLSASEPFCILRYLTPLCGSSPVPFHGCFFSSRV